MTIPSLPPFYKMNVSEKKGEMTTEYQLYNDQLWQSLNTVINYFQNGVVMPSKTTAEITALEPKSAIGTVWFNTTLAKLQVKTASGTIETITSS